LQEPLPTSAPRNKLRLAIRVLERLLPEAPRREPSPREVRARVFRAASAAHLSRRAVFERVARELRVEVDRVEESLFADLAGQRRVAALPAELSPAELARLANQALVFAFLKRAERVRIKAWGHDTGALVRHARSLGLICVASKLEPASADALPGVVLDLSGPFALFRKTELYGRSLASLLPRAARCHHFELEADCALAPGPQRTTLHLSPYDPIYSERPLPKVDARVATRFARDFARLSSRWGVVREPPPLEIGDDLLFADVELAHREHPERRFFLELLGFWTADYVRGELAKLSAASIENVILCVHESRRVSADELAPDPRVVRYKTHLDAAAILAIVEA